MCSCEEYQPPEVLSLRRKVRILLVLFIAGLVLAGLSALPLRAEVIALQRLMESLSVERWWPALAAWMSRVHEGVMEAGREQPFLFYGTDFWQLIDCSFGILGFIPLCLAGRYTRRIPTPVSP